MASLEENRSDLSGSEDEDDERLGAGSTAIPPDQIAGNTRFYKSDFPSAEELVIVKVEKIAEMGAYVSLLEYNGIEGMILLSELSRRRIRSINRLLRVGRDEVVMVIRVNKDKGYVDLSKRRATPEDVVTAQERYNKAKAVHAIVRHVSAKLKVPMLSLYERIFWPLYKKFGHAYDALQLAVTDPDAVLGPVEGTLPAGATAWPVAAEHAAAEKPAGIVVDITPEERKELHEFIITKMKPQPLRIRADVLVSCAKYEGVEAVRRALLAAQAKSTEAVPIKVQLIAPPLYVMTTSSLDKVAGIEALTAAIAACKEEIEAAGGQIFVKRAPTVTSSKDETDLQRMLEDLEAANAGVWRRRVVRRLRQRLRERQRR